MKLKLLITILTAAIFSVGVHAEIDEKTETSYVADCKRYAVEDGIAAEEMENYIATCVDEMVGSEAETAPSESEAAESQE